MLSNPRKTKFKKVQKGSLPSKICGKKRPLQQGTYALKAYNSVILSSSQIESCRKLLAKKIKNKGRLWVKVFPHTPVSKKPVEVRMGKGKGAVDSWVCKIKAGSILYEITGVQKSTAEEVLKEGSRKLPMRTLIVSK